MAAALSQRFAELSPASHLVIAPVVTRSTFQPFALICCIAVTSCFAFDGCAELSPVSQLIVVPVVTRSKLAPLRCLVTPVCHS
jgi:hypothetical protein